MSKENELRITELEGDLIDVVLNPITTPIAYKRKKQELIEHCGITENEAENILLRPISLEVFYSLDQGLFAIEAEPLADIPVYNPYTGKEIPNDNL